MSARSKCFFLFLLLLAPVIPADSASLDDADVRLFKVQLAMAEKGDTRAQYYLGEMHEQGLGTRQNVDEAYKWYVKAAEQGDPLAKRKLAHRQEITSEIKMEQEVEKLNPSATATTSANPSNSSTPIAVAQSDQARQHEQGRIKAAERAKKRAKVRAMILERMRHPVGAPFGE